MPIYYGVTLVTVSFNAFGINNKIRSFSEQGGAVAMAVFYGSTKRQVEKQLKCDHEWHGPCIDSISRYYKCKKCYCMDRDCSENEYYEALSEERKNCFGIKSIIESIKKLNLTNGDVVVVTVDSYPSDDVVKELTRNVRERQKLNVDFIILTPGQTIQTLDEKEMNNYGWFRPNKRMKYKTLESFRVGSSLLINFFRNPKRFRVNGGEWIEDLNKLRELPQFNDLLEIEYEHYEDR